MSETVSVGCRNRAVTGSTEQFKDKGASKTAIWSRTYANTGGGGSGGWKSCDREDGHRLQSVERKIWK